MQGDRGGGGLERFSGQAPHPPHGASWRTAPALPAHPRLSAAIRSHLRRRGIRAVIPRPSDQVGHRLRRGRRGGRPPGFGADACTQRDTLERRINRLKQWRGLATRADKLAVAYQAALHLAGILIWARR